MGLVLAAALAACTGPSPAGPAPRTPSPPAATRSLASAPELVLTAVASLGGPTSVEDRGAVDGMRLAEEEVNERGGVAGRLLRVDVVDDGGDVATAHALLSAALSSGSAAATILVGPGDPLVALRRQVEAAGGPVLLVGGDLYSSRALYRQVFQAGIPVLWQSRVIARYLVRDRRHDRVVLVTEAGPGEAAAREAFDAATAEEGRGPDVHVSVDPGGDMRAALRPARGADAVVVLASAATAAAVSEAVAGLADPPQLAASSDALSPAFAAGSPAPGTVAPHAYTWAGWAEPIPHVAGFRGRFRERFGRDPAGLEQEGYDAVRVLAEALEATGGRGGRRLVTALERRRPRPHSSLPVRLGPDDHVFVGQHELGLFAVPSPEGPMEPWVGPAAPWRPVMRTFTSDGEKTSVLDRDKRAFFPRWRKPRPSPPYWRSRFGIVTGPDDPLH